MNYESFPTQLRLHLFRQSSVAVQGEVRGQVVQLLAQLLLSAARPVAQPDQEVIDETR